MAAGIFKTQRAKAWRNLMVLAINEGLDRGVFTLDEPASEVRDAAPVTYPVRLPDGTTRDCSVRDIGWGELSVRFLDLGKRNWIDAIGWLERREGKWLQGDGPGRSFRCPRLLTEALASMSPPEPVGYRDHGRFFL